MQPVKVYILMVMCLGVASTQCGQAAPTGLVLLHVSLKPTAPAVPGLKVTFLATGSIVRSQLGAAALSVSTSLSMTDRPGGGGSESPVDVLPVAVWLLV